MNDLLSWLKEYSPGVVALLAFGAAMIFVLRTTVEKAVSARMDVYTQEVTLRLGRRSNFEERVLTDRYNAFVDLTTRLQRVMTNINRLQHGNEVEEGFMRGNEVVPLTSVYEDLNIRQLVLGDKLHSLLREAARIALWSSNYKHLSEDEYAQVVAQWSDNDVKLRQAAEVEFGISKIHW